MIKIRGTIWFIRNYGIRRFISYERFRRSGGTINYAEIFTPDELAILEEHGLSMWGKRIR
jgi:hypothetical protein